MTQLYMKQEVNSKGKFFDYFLVAIRDSIAYDSLSFLPKFNFFYVTRSIVERIDGAKEGPVETVSRTS